MFFGGYPYNGPTSPTSPTRTSLWGGGCTSPFRNTNMPLQEITMNQSYFPVGANSRSPGKTGSGTGVINGGRTMKDYEDQLGALQKENFNLKLRIYFLEEKMNISSADEDAVRNNIELKVQAESLRKELIEKQELLSQAAKAFQLHEEQKEAATRNQAQYQQSLENQRQRIEDLEHELEEYKDKLVEPSMYYKDSLGITPEAAIENKEKLQQMEEFVESLEAEVKRLSASLVEERVWGQEVEAERDQLKSRLENETRTREKLTTMRDSDIELLRQKIKELEEIALKRESAAQQYKNELDEKDRLIREKISLLEEKCKACEELSQIAERRQKQVDQLRASIKSRDDTITDLNSKYRALRNKIENSHSRRVSPPGSPLALEESSRSSQRSPFIGSPTNSLPSQFNFESGREKAARLVSQAQSGVRDEREIRELTKELEERDKEIKKQEEVKRQLMLKLCNLQESSSATEKELKKMKPEYDNALAMIQDLVQRQDRLLDRQARKDKKLFDMKEELRRLREVESARGSKSSQSVPVRRNLSSEIIDEKEASQQRFEELETKINDLRDEIETVRAEKNRLEKQIQDESEELRDQLTDKQRKIDFLEMEKNRINQELAQKDSEISRMRAEQELFENELPKSIVTEEKERLEQELISMSREIDEKNQRIDQLSRELQIKTQNLQQLVNTELWSKNKEIAKLHNHMTANQSQGKTRSRSESIQDCLNSQLDILVKELHDIGIKVNFSEDKVQLNYKSQHESTDIKTVSDHIQSLMTQKTELEKEVEYLKWLKLISRPDIESGIDSGAFESERAKEYCEMLRTHMKDLVKFMKEMLKSSNYSSTSEYKRIILDLLVGSKILSEDFVHALEGVTTKQATMEDICTCKEIHKAGKNSSEIIKEIPCSVQSDSEAFSEPDRNVSLARIGLQEMHHKSSYRPRFSKHMKTFSDSEDSLDYVPYYKTYQNDLNDFDASHQIQELRETNNLLYSELSQLRTEITMKTSHDILIDEKIRPIMMKLEKSQDFCEKIQCAFEKKMHESYSMKRETKQNNNTRKIQLEKKMIDVENMALEIAQQKSELLHYKENNERKTADMMMTLNRETDSMRLRMKKLEEENESARGTISALTKELDRLTLSHSQVLVENTKLTNDKLRLEQEIRKSDTRLEMTIRSLQEKFNKEVSDLNQTNDFNRTKMHELENVNEELRRQVVVCEVSDSAPSSSGISSIPTEANLKGNCDDVLQEYHFNRSQYWMPINYPASTGRSKSSCSPDLGIESDAAISTTRPLKDTLKITESMTNLLSDEENCNDHQSLRDLDRESPLHLEGGHNYSLDEVEALKKENEALKKRLMKTRRALEDTFEHLSASNKNKKNVEKAITKQLMITKSILKKTRTYEEPFDN